jgi:putative flippase GtrA
MTPSSADPDPSAPSQTVGLQRKKAASLWERIFWYGVAGVVTIALNPALYTLFNDVFGWVNWVAYALSLGLVNILQFIWSYHVGFRTTDHWTTSAKRQGVTLVGSNLLNYFMVIGLQAVFPQWEKIIIVAVQVFIAGVKFIVYHYWVYPERPDSAQPAERAP